MQEVLSLRSSAEKKWRSRDAAARLIIALSDPHGRPRWMAGFTPSKHKRGKNPSVIIKTTTPGVEYRIKALRNDFVANQFRKSYPDSSVVPLVISEGEPMSQIRERVFAQINRIRQK